MKARFALHATSVAAVLLLGWSNVASPQAPYPAKSIRLIVPWPPGGGADVLTPMLTTKLSESLGQQIIIDTRGGAAGNIGAELAARAPPDGYTIVFAYAGTHPVNPSLYSQLALHDTHSE